MWYNIITEPGMHCVRNGGVMDTKNEDNKKSPYKDITQISVEINEHTVKLNFPITADDKPLIEIQRILLRIYQNQ